VVHALAFPVVAWMLFAAVNWGWHFSVLYDQALENELLHYVQHATFLAAALLFWWPVVGADPSPWRLAHPVRLLYVFLAMPQNSFLGVALMSAGSVLYPHYVTNLRDWGPTPLEDQQLGGILMWVVGDVAFLAAMAVVVVMWMRYEERRTVRVDARLAADRAARGEEPWTPR
jgi:putative copper resistance protein D